MDYSQIDLKGYAPKDIKIIKDNPDKSIYDLTMLGLSAKAAEKLQLVKPSEAKAAAVDSAEPAIAQPVEVKQVAMPATKPQLSKLSAMPANTKGVKVYNSHTGQTQHLSEATANRLLAQPDKYQRVG